jgi:hypothetical protein
VFLLLSKNASIKEVTNVSVDDQDGFSIWNDNGFAHLKTPPVDETPDYIDLAGDLFRPGQG